MNREPRIRIKSASPHKSVVVKRVTYHELYPARPPRTLSLVFRSHGALPVEETLAKYLLAAFPTELVEVKQPEPAPEPEPVPVAEPEPIPAPVKEATNDKKPVNKPAPRKSGRPKRSV